MKTQATHKHIKMNGHWFHVNFKNGRWETNSGASWGETPEQAIAEYIKSNICQIDCEPTTIQELHEIDN